MARIYVTKSTTDLGTITTGSGAAGIIGTGDDLCFMEGGQEVSAGLNQSALAAGLATLEFGPQFTGNIGSAAAGPLRCDVDSGASLVTMKNGGGNVYLYPGGGSSLISRIKQLGQANLYLTTGGTVTNLEVGQTGRYASATGDVIVTNFRQSGGESNIEYIVGTSAMTAIRIDGGVASLGRFLKSDASGPTAIISGNAYVKVRRVDTSSTRPTATGTSTSAVLTVCGGTLDWQGGNIDTLVVLGDGVFDCWNAPQAFEITNLRITAKALARSRFKSRHATVTVPGAGGSMEIYGGETDSLIA